jgi:hypothetical protein
MSDDDQGRPYRVGKGKPPLEHRWRAGQPSPNPKGRPKGPTRDTELRKMLRRKVEVTGPDGRLTQKTFEAVVAHKLVERAIKGDFAAIKLITQLALKQSLAELSDAQTRQAEQPDPGEAAERERLSQRLVKLLEDKASRKRRGGQG